MLLEVKELVAGYGDKEVVRGISLNVEQGEIVSMFGHNGAGKTTMLNTIFGLIATRKGKVLFQGKDITNRGMIQNVREGICLVPQGRGVFNELGVVENLRLGAYSLNGAEFSKRLKDIWRLFPVLEQRKSQMAGTLSGGEQQMLALGISLMVGPKLLLLDEPSVGLAPVLVQKVMQTIKEINQQAGTSVLLVEQNLRQALCVTDRCYVMKVGQIILCENKEKFSCRPDYWDLM